MTLTTPQMLEYKRNGYLCLRQFYAHDELRTLRQWALDMAIQAETPGQQWMYFEKSATPPYDRILSRIENFVPFHDGFRLLIGGRLQEVVTDLLGEPTVLFKDKINYKLAGGDGSKAHQDSQAGWGEYASLFLTAMVALDPSNTTNGGLEVVGGLGLSGLIGQLWAPLTQEETAGMTFEPVDCDPGDAVFFDSFVPHRSAPNTTHEPRRVLYITYNRLAEGDQRERYYEDKRRNYPPDCERVQGQSYVYKV